MSLSATAKTGAATVMAVAIAISGLMADATFELSDADMQALSHYLATRP